MRYFVIALLASLLVACGPKINHYAKQNVVSAYDFTPYSQQGFLFTPYQYGDKYEAIGIVQVEIWPEMTYGVDAKKPIKGFAASKEWIITDAGTPKEVIELAYQKAKGMNANALASVRIWWETGESSAGPVPVVKFEGFAIRRE